MVHLIHFTNVFYFFTISIPYHIFFTLQWKSNEVGLFYPIPGMLELSDLIWGALCAPMNA